MERCTKCQPRRSCVHCLFDLSARAAFLRHCTAPESHSLRAFMVLHSNELKMESVAHRGTHTEASSSQFHGALCMFELMANFFDSVCDGVPDCTKLLPHEAAFEDFPSTVWLPVLSAIYTLTHLNFPLSFWLMYAPADWWKHRGHAEWAAPLLMRERLKDPNAFPVSLRASEEICCLLRSESLKLKCVCWQRTNGIFPLRKRCRIVLACSKCQGKMSPGRHL